MCNSLVRVEDKRAVFDGLVYELTEAGQLRVSVTLKQDEGSFHMEVVQLTRKSL